MPFGVESGEPAQLTGIFHPAGPGADGRARHALGYRRVRDRLRGQVGVLAVAVLLGGVSAAVETSAPAGPAGGIGQLSGRGSGRRAAVRARGARVVVDRRSHGRHGRRAWDGPRDARLVRRDLGRDDGGNDVPVGGADGGAVLAHDARARCRRAAAVRRGLPAWCGPRPASLAYGVFRAGRALLGDQLAWDQGGRWLAGGTLLVAAAYELSPLKDVCLAKCRSPFGYLMGSWRNGRAGALRMGAGHGAWCLGCCWALMAALFALGVMSLVWTAVVAGVIALEKTLPYKRVAVWGTAAFLVALAVGVLAFPHDVPGLTVPGGSNAKKAMDSMQMAP